MMQVTSRGILAFAFSTTLFTCIPAFAQEVPIVNASFESVILADGTFAFSVPGWTFSGASTGTFNPAAAQYPGGQVPDGSNVAFISQSNPDTLAQVLTTTLTANTRYTLRVDVGDRLDETLGPYDVQLLAGGVILDSDGSVVPGDGEFATVTVAYTARPSDAQLGQLLEIRLVVPGGSGTQVNFDNVRLFAAEIALSGAPTASHFGLAFLLLALVTFGVTRLRVPATE